MSGKTSLSSKLLIDDLVKEDFAGKKVLIRVDFNVPLDRNLEITNNARIQAAIPTIKRVLENEPSKVIVMSHLGRPNGEYDAKYSLKPVYKELQSLLSTDEDKPVPAEKVFLAEDCVGDDVEKTIEDAPNGSVILLENLRFHLEEEGSKKDATGKPIKADAEKTKEFREGLTKLGDLYINDAFGTAHRAHSSMVGIGEYSKQDMKKAAGLLMAKELTFFAQALEDPEKPFVAILGGAKVSDKIKLIKNMLLKVDKVIIGGAMALTFAFYFKRNVGNSKVDREGAPSISEFLPEGDEDAQKTFAFPTDYFTTTDFQNPNDSNTEASVSIKEGIPDGAMGVDIGTETIKSFCDIIYPEDETKQPKTILWNGPPGVFEIDLYAEGSKAMLAACEKAVARGAKVIVGGGDTATVVSKFGDPDKLTHVSTGGGASLELLEGADLPGVVALSDKQ